MKEITITKLLFSVISFFIKICWANWSIKAVLWIRNDLFWIQLKIFRIRIQAKVPDLDSQPCIKVKSRIQINIKCCISATVLKSHFSRDAVIKHFFVFSRAGHTSYFCHRIVLFYWRVTVVFCRRFFLDVIAVLRHVSYFFKRVNKKKFLMNVKICLMRK